MNIAIIGSGGVGGYFGGRLAVAGNHVTFLARGKHLDAIKKDGLKINSINGDFFVHPANATDSIPEIGPVELVILAVKAWQVKDFASAIKPIVAADTLVLPLQNGVSAADDLCSVLNEKNVLGGLCKILSKIDAPGTINHVGIDDPNIVFGGLDHKVTESIRALKDVFDNAGINTRIADNIHSELWKKFISICVSALLAVCRSSYGVVRELPQTRQMTVELLTEIFLVSRKAGILLDDDIVDKTMGAIDAYPYDSVSSLTRDVMNGLPSEIDYQNGWVVKLGEKYNVPTPVNRFMCNCILPMEIKARKEIESKK
ncbi:MAG: 2-dehydropantoate 2-reductase [bacterium]|nr:2-dehydropantoate 2-reductase [bacterium]